MFNWDKKLMQKNLDILLSKEQPTNYDEEIIEFYTTQLNQHALVKEEFPKENMDEETIIKMLKMNRDDLAYYFSDVLPNSIGIQFYNLVESLGPLYTLKLYHEPFVSLRKKKVDNSFIDMSHDIFSSISNDYTKYLNYIYKNNLVKTKKKTDVIELDSCCYCDVTNKAGFVYINRNHKYSNESVYNHELTHSLTTVLNYPIIIDDRLNFISEAHPIFIGTYTDKKLYEKTNDPGYLKSIYNYSLHLRQAVNVLYFYQKLCQLDEINIEEIRKILEISLNINFNDDDSFKSYIKALANANVASHFKYIVSSFASVHLLNKDEEKQKYLFNKSLLEEGTTVYNFFKTLEYPIKDKYYACDTFNKYALDAKMNVRERK